MTICTMYSDIICANVFSLTLLLSMYSDTIRVRKRKEDKTMTHEEIKAFYENQVKFYEKEIKFDNGQIEWETKNLARARKEVRDLAEWVWSKGPLTEMEMRIWGDKNYESPEMRKAKNARKNWYTRRKKDTAALERYTRLLENM